MTDSVFITGASGFLGSYFLEELNNSRFKTIYVLVRNKNRIKESLAKNISIIEGDLLDVESYQQVLDKVDTVVHLAAITGKSKPALHFQVNSEGTKLLIAGCKAAGVKNILHVSTIAVKFNKKKRYFYALAKQEAEKAVETSGIDYLIVRPTMIMGPGAPVFKGLEMFAGLPVVPVFGRGKSRIQPIHVRDMARILCFVLSKKLFVNAIAEVGGKEVITIEDFIKKIHKYKTGKDPAVIHLPVGIIVALLTPLEKLVYSLLPVTIGQLASFRNDGTADKNRITKEGPLPLMGVEEIIVDSLDKKEIASNHKALKKECAVFCRYLVAMNPDEYIINKYILIHQKKDDLSASDHFDRLLLKISTVGTFLTKICDAYSRFFRPGSLLRKKLVYLFALLEVSPPYYKTLDQCTKKGIAGLFSVMFFKGVYFALHLFISVLLLLPLQIVLGRGREKPKEDKN